MNMFAQGGIYIVQAHRFAIKSQLTQNEAFLLGICFPFRVMQKNIPTLGFDIAAKS